LAPKVLAGVAGVWHTPPREEGHPMNEQQKDAWAGILLGLMFLVTLLGGLLVLRLTGH
jgi:hypothetical protein